MSDPRRWTHPAWPAYAAQRGLPEVTAKELERDRAPMHLRAPGRFRKNGRNARINLVAKNERLALREALEE